jgi:hypothetical protein
MPGSVLITDFGANGAQDMIDLSAISGYSSFADVAATASFPGSDTVLTIAVPNGVLTLTVNSDTPLTSADFGLPADPNGPAEIAAPGVLVNPVDPIEPLDPVSPVAPADQSDTTGLTYTLQGADAHHFNVDQNTGDIGNMDWFTPSYNQIWDISGDRIYEVERIGSDANGEEVSHSFFELETTLDGVVWREVSGEDGDTDSPQSIEEGGTFFLEGPDSYHFVIDPESGEIGNALWFDPSYDQIWDTSGDRIYEFERYALAEDGREISREAFEMETTPDGVVWRSVPMSDDGEMSGAEIMSALALAPAQEKDVPPEPEDSDDDVILPV